MKRYCFALDLKNDPQLIKEYVNWHTKIWPEIRESITSTGIVVMDIYLVGNRMFMIMETEDQFSLEEKARRDELNPVVRKWEQLMWRYQQTLPFSNPGEKWMLMEKIFQL